MAKDEVMEGSSCCYVHQTQNVLGRGKSLFGGKCEPLDGRLVVLRDNVSFTVNELLSKVVYGFVMRRRDPGVLHSRI